MNGLDISDFPEMGRGIMASKPIEPGQEVLYIPSHLIISSSLIKNSTDKTHQLFSKLFSTDHELLAAFILFERAKVTSFWTPYLSILPSYVPNLAHYIGTELEELQDRTLVQEVRESTQKTIQNFNQFKQKVAPYWLTNINDVTLQDYIWVSSILDSRGFRFRGAIHLAPFSDMFNYSPHSDPRPPNSGNFFLEHHKLSSDALQVTADR